MAGATEARGMFSSVNFHIIIGNKLSEGHATELRSQLLANGAAEHAPPSRDGLCELEGLTHLIAGDVDFEGYQEAEDRMVSIVNAGWIEASITKGKLANPKSHSPDPRMFFSGLVVHPVGLPVGDTDAIIGGVLAMGGLYSSTLTRLVTHIVAMNPQNASCATAEQKGLSCKTVLPHWIDDCLKLGKCIDEGPYSFPNPEILSHSRNGTASGTSPAVLNGASSTRISGPPTPSSSPSSNHRPLTVLRNKTICLASDLVLSHRLQNTIEQLVQKAGGKVSSTLAECNILVCQHRTGGSYAEAYRDGKTIGSLPWLYWMISHDSWTSPLKRLLHYPTDPRGLPGFSDYRICLSNYSGEARIYLENLAKAAGSEFTKTMKTDNTHLITAHTISEKCEAASEWGITMINHLWLEESYAKWEVQDVTKPRYTHFPSRTNLTEVVGQTQIDKAALESQFQKDFGDVDETASESEMDLGLDGASNGPKPNINLASPDGSPAKTVAQKADRSEAESPTEFATPAPKKRRSVDKENEEPTGTSTGSRSAKAKAAARLHNLADDIALYERERKRKSGGIFGGRRSVSSADSIKERKRSSAEPDDVANPARKKAKNSKEPLRIRMLMTGVSKYDGHDKASLKLRDELRDIGILITESENQCRYLIAPRILRTKKFVCAIAQAPTLVSPEFLDECLQEEELLDPEDFPFKDSDGEKEYQLKMNDVLDRADANRQRMLKGYSIWVTDKVKGGFEAYKAIVEINGGKCLAYQGRTGAVPRVNYDSDDEDSKPEPAYLICSEDDAQLAEKFRAAAAASNRDPQIVKTDWLLDAALSQEIGDTKGYLHNFSY